ncbi:hypothetical protein HMG84_19115, partial [Salmonella enterica subsp. enterica serovar Muenchen]|nr:hypothetical protein [Salmonella enterica subsp. enterica serovar Muenchen]
CIYLNLMILIKIIRGFISIAPAFEQAKALMAQYRVPVVVEVILERVTNISMGSELDNVTEFEEVADSAKDAPTETCFMKYE